MSPLPHRGCDLVRRIKAVIEAAFLDSIIVFEIFFYAETLTSAFLNFSVVSEPGDAES